MTTLARILDRIADNEQEIVGIKEAYKHDKTPNDIRIYPCFINMPGVATYDYSFGDATWQTRVIRLLLYLAPVERPSDVARHLDGLEPFYQRVVAKFKSDRTLNDLVGVSYITGDGGAEMLEYAGKRFSGIEFLLTVEQQL